MTVLRVLKVFEGPDRGGGNPLGVVLDGDAVPETRRQALAATLGFSETVFVDDAARGVIRIHTPVAELRFAGHPTVGTGWLLRQLGIGGTMLRPPAGDVATWQDRELSWIRARPEWVHEIERIQYPTAPDVDALTGPQGASGSTYAWAWIDEAAGLVRARYFVPAYGIGEDEATGAAAVMMGGLCRRVLEIHQGVGSVLHVRPGGGRHGGGGRTGDVRRDPGDRCLTRTGSTPATAGSPRSVNRPCERSRWRA